MYTGIDRVGRAMKDLQRAKRPVMIPEKDCLDIFNAVYFIQHHFSMIFFNGCQKLVGGGA